MPRIFVGTFLVVAACSDQISINLPPGTDGGTCSSDVVDALPVTDAGIDASKLPDAMPATQTMLGEKCNPNAPGACPSPLICSPTVSVCTITCGVNPNDHEWCGYWDQQGVCSRTGISEGRCYIGCNSNIDCPFNTFCNRGVDNTGGPSPYLFFCSGV